MERLAIWLTPGEPAASLLRRAIHAFALAQGRAPFEPHLTLASGLPREDADGVLRDVAARSRALALTPRGVLSGGDFKASASLDLAPTPAYEGVRAAILASFAWREAPRPPHISLTYGAVAREIADALGRGLTAPIVFDALCAVTYDAPIDSQEKVARWRQGAPVRLLAA